MKVAIIGAGLAGTACAYMLKQRNVDVEIYEAGDSIAPGASGNEVGLYNPRLSAEPGFYKDAFEVALKTFPKLGDVDWNPCGALHLMTDEKRALRYTKMVESWDWPPDDVRVVSAAEASRLAGIDLKYDALWLGQSGYVSPRKLCEAYAKDVTVHFNTPVDDFSRLAADVVILACGFGVQKFFDLGLQQVRGQITQVKENSRSQGLQCTLGYGGYIAPAVRGVHNIGATFQRWLSHSDIVAQDDTDNLAKLGEVVDLGAFEVTGHRASVRTTSKDHFPVIGAVRDTLYVSTGHGSHGILSSLAGAHLLAAQITGSALPFDAEVLQPARFLV